MEEIWKYKIICEGNFSFNMEQAIWASAGLYTNYNKIKFGCKILILSRIPRAIRLERKKIEKWI